MPASASFPSGHTASAVAFAIGAGAVLPGALLPLWSLASAIACSRVHYPGDVAAGAVLGVASAVTARRLSRALPGRRTT